MLLFILNYLFSFSNAIYSVLLEATAKAIQGCLPRHPKSIKNDFPNKRGNKVNHSSN